MYTAATNLPASNSTGSWAASSSLPVICALTYTQRGDHLGTKGYDLDLMEFIKHPLKSVTSRQVIAHTSTPLCLQKKGKHAETGERGDAIKLRHPNTHRPVLFRRRGYLLAPPTLFIFARPPVTALSFVRRAGSSPSKQWQSCGTQCYSYTKEKYKYLK